MDEFQECGAYMHYAGTHCVRGTHPVTSPHIDYLGREADPVAEQAWADDHAQAREHDGAELDELDRIRGRDFETWLGDEELTVVQRDHELDEAELDRQM